MATIDKQSIQNLIKLSRIECSEQEQESLVIDLAKVLSYIEQLQDIDTDNVTPCNTVLEDIGNVLRDDVVGETLPREVFLSNAPSQVGGIIRVPPVIKSN